jgi:sugar lactone lactonase YvrE
MPEIVAPLPRGLSESPIWIADEQRLLFVSSAPALHRLDPASGELETFALGEEATAVAPIARDRVLLARVNRLDEIDLARRTSRVVAELPEEHRHLRFNDAACDVAGRFWIGTANPLAGPTIVDGEQLAAGIDDAGLYTLGSDGSLRLVCQRLTVSNGIGWSLDGRRMFHVDSTTHRIDVFDVQPRDGVITNRRRFAAIPHGHGWPDGLAVDREGGVWVALFGGGVVRRFLPDGRTDRDIVLPVSQVTSCCFGGAGLDDLFITTASVGSGPAEPMGGSVFRYRASVPGVATGTVRLAA